jgi:hypothetical protein
LRSYFINGSKIFSIIFELQNGQINKPDNSSKYIPQLLQCHFIFKPFFQYRFVPLHIIIFSFLGGYQLLKQTHDYLFIRIRVLSTIVSSLCQRCMYNLSFRIVKFVVTESTFIFWCLSVSGRNINTFTFWTYFNKIPSRLKK